MRPWNPNTKATGRPGYWTTAGYWTPPLRQTVPVGAHCASAHWATEAGFFVWLLLIYFSRTNVYREETPGRILTRNGSKDAESRKDVPLGLWNEKLESEPYLTPKTLKKNWPWIGNFQPKWWNIKLQVYQNVPYQSRWKISTMLGT